MNLGTPVHEVTEGWSLHGHEDQSDFLLSIILGMCFVGFYVKRTITGLTRLILLRIPQTEAMKPPGLLTIDVDNSFGLLFSIGSWIDGTFKSIIGILF